MFCRTPWLSCVALLAVGVMHGCASSPTTLLEGIEAETHEAKVRDAHLDHVAGHPGLRVNDEMRALLDVAITTENIEDARRLGLAFVDAAEAEATRSVPVELERLPESRRQALRLRFIDPMDDPQTTLSEAYRQQTAADAAALRARLLKPSGLGTLRSELVAMQRRIEKPLRRQGRVARMLPWLALAPASQWAADHIYHEEYRGNADTAFTQATAYYPEGEPQFQRWPSPDDAQLLQRFAPVIVQEATPDDANYAPQVDHIGHVVAPDTERVVVLTDRAVLYAYSRRVYIQGQPHTQLVYTHWYPEHPELEQGDPEAGHTEGVTLRITLDRDLKPAVFETVYNCGCYHRLYPAKRLDDAAMDQYGLPQPGKSLAIERQVAGRKDLIVPNVVEVPDEPDARPVIRVRAGWHGIVNVGFVTDKYPREHHAQACYTLEPYEHLERLCTPDGQVTSMFYDNGLVKQAQRKEGVYFTPAGILSAGQPRQRGTQLILWDDWDFDAATLFEQALRLPSEF